MIDEVPCTGFRFTQVLPCNYIRIRRRLEFYWIRARGFYGTRGPRFTGADEYTRDYTRALFLRMTMSIEERFNEIFRIFIAGRVVAEVISFNFVHTHIFMGFGR